MNIELFNKLMEQRPFVNPNEWKMFLEICETYLKKYAIKDPIVVELGIYKNKQKKFYEQLLKAKHIGIDITRKRHPDIHGDTHDSRTLQALKEKLKGKSINILFIDADHSYESVKKDFEIYSPLCSDIIALHDIHVGRHQNKIEGVEVWKFWDELIREDKEFSFISIDEEEGIGIILKK